MGKNYFCENPLTDNHILPMSVNNHLPVLPTVGAECVHLVFLGSCEWHEARYKVILLCIASQNTPFNILLCLF